MSLQPSPYQLTLYKSQIRYQYDPDSMLEPLKKVQQVESPPDTRSLPPTFDPAYIEGAVKPFFLSSKHEGDPCCFQ